MTIEAKKVGVVSRILNIEDEELIDAIAASIGLKYDSKDSIKNRFPTLIEDKTVLESIIEKQSWKPTDPERIDQIIQQADIQEPIEKLLDDLRS